MQTLVIASAASMAAALVTSRLFPPGAPFTAAVTPVIVAMVSEMLHRPANRMSELREARRTMVREAELLHSARTGLDAPPEGGAWTDPLPPPPGRGYGNGAGGGQVRIHGGSRWGRVHPRVAIATGLLAFTIGAAALTLPELIFGGAAVTGKRTTLVPVGGSSKKSSPKQQTQTTPQPTQTQTTPAQQQPQQTTTTDTTTTSPTTPTETTPSGGGAPAPAPTPTTPTETTPAPAPAP
jgi:hypothetical protein